MVKGLTETKRLGFIASAISVPVAIVVMLMVFSSAATARLENDAPTEPKAVRQPMAVEPRVTAESNALQDSFVFRFDPALESFETFTIPTGGARPHSVVVVSNVTNLDVWFTEPDTDQIGRLVYTTTDNFAFREYTVTVAGRPLDLVVDEGRGLVWFTEQAGNRIGRLEIGSNSVVTYATFDVDTLDSQPTGIDLAPDGSVWFTEMDADQLGHLVVTTTSDYDVIEHPINGTDVGAYGIKVQSAQYVWFTELNAGWVKRLKVADGSFVTPTMGLGADSQPYDLEIVGEYLWLTERGDSELTQGQLTTNFWLNSFELPHPAAGPAGLAVVGDNQFWYAQRNIGALGRMVYTSALDVDFATYTLPLDGLLPLDVDADGGGNLWSVAYRRHRVYLPVLANNYDNDPPPPFGVQMYGTITNSTGLTWVTGMGGRWIRVPFSWRYVEPTDVTPTLYNWTWMDKQVNAVTGEGVELLFTLGGNPGWAAQYAQGPVTDTADLVEFMGAVVERYDGDGTDDAPGSPVVTYWEFYNEPDGTSEWHAEHGGYGFFGYHGDDYAALLDAVYPVIKAASPKAQVVFGGIANDYFVPGGIFDPDFLDDVLANCSGPCFDVMNFHYYPFYRYRWESHGKDVLGKAKYITSKLADYGFERPLMVSEASWPAATTWGSIEQNARYVPILFARSLAGDLMAVIWWALYDMDSSYSGLMSADLVPRDSYYAFRVLTEQLGQARFVRALTEAETGGGDIEGYVFDVPGDDRWERRDVIWLDCPSLQFLPPQDCPGSSQLLTVASDELRITQVDGAVSIVADGDDGQSDGHVTLTIRPAPIYVDYTP
jgi:streptogramin lyase